MNTNFDFRLFVELDFLLFNLIFTLLICVEFGILHVEFEYSLTYKLLNLNVRMLNLICKRYTVSIMHVLFWNQILISLNASVLGFQQMFIPSSLICRREKKLFDGQN